MVELARPVFKVARYGWRPDRPDWRDRPWLPRVEDLSAAQAVITNKTTIDLRTSGFMPEPYDQSQLGSCTANSAAGNIEYNRARLGLPSVGTPSRLFIYYNTRVAEGTINQDSGATIRDSIQACAAYGAPSEAEWPYDLSKFTVTPPAQAFTDALDDVDLSYNTVQQDDLHIVSSLLKGLAVQIGFTVYESFEQDVSSNGIMPWPGHSEKVVGGHAVLVVGIAWVNSEAYWIVRNSWGSGWADSGYFYMPLRYLTTRGYASDFWQVDLVGKKTS